MAAENIGNLIPTKIPGYADAADIQAALRLYHYGSYEFDVNQTNANNLVNPSIAYTINDLQEQVDLLDQRPSSGGDPAATAPVAGDFNPSGVPNGFIWLDTDGVLGGAPTSATSVFSNLAPTTNLTSGLIWIDKDAEGSAANPYVATSIINAKGDIVVGTANDTVSVLPAGTNGKVLKSNSGTSTGLEWSDDVTYLQPTIGTTAIPSGTSVTNISGLTLTSATLAGNSSVAQILESTAIYAIALGGTINYDVTANGAVTYFTANATGNWTLNMRASSTATLNSIMNTNQSLTIALMATNGATPYYMNTFQIDGVSFTPKWQGGSAPTGGNASSVDIYSITITKTGNAAFTVFAAQTKFA